MAGALIPAGDAVALSNRKLSAETCAKFGYTVGTYNGRPAQIAPYYDTHGNLIAQHIRMADKRFAWTGEMSKTCLFGQNIWRDGGKKLVITEGEMDAMSVSQCQGNRWPVCSIPSGVNDAANAIQRNIDWIERFEEVVFAFDNDEPGRTAALGCAALLTPGKAKIATLPLKDASDMLVAGRVQELMDCLWGAKEFRPDGIVSLAEIAHTAKEPPTWGLPWPWPTLTQATYGRRHGEVYTLGAGTGIGKTDVFTQCISADLSAGRAVGVFYLEQPPAETVRRLAGKLAGKRFHVPDAGWTTEELCAAIDALQQAPCFLYNHFGATDWQTIRGHIRYLSVAHGVKLIYLDHLTALAAHADDERRELESLMADLAGLAQEQGLIIHLISHLATPEGKPHEEGGRVMIRHFKGSRSIGYWSHFMFGMERDQQTNDETTRHLTTFRVLKDRYTGTGTGVTFYLNYEAETGMLTEAEGPPVKEGFKDERGSKHGTDEAF